MKSIVLNSLSVITFLLAVPVFSQIKATVDTGLWAGFFKETALEGTFVLLDDHSGEYYIYNQERAKRRFLPASTFKIMNTLIGLQNHTVEGIETVFKWDGIQRSYDAWNKDLSLQEAFRNSAVWVYQELARRTGREVIEEWIVRCHYGNERTGPEIDRFWLDGDIAISAVEQVDFIRHLCKESLPFDNSVQKLVKDIMLADSVNGRKLHAKTGWVSRIENETGWYVGYVESIGNVWIFALNIDIKNEEDARYRKEISRRILDATGIFPLKTE
ncbi:MAG: class D beta-lactamase [Bacteroidota bacterium]